MENSESSKDILLYLMSLLGRVEHDRLFELVFIANSKGVISYEFTEEAGAILSSEDLRRDLTDLIRKGHLVDELAKVSEEFDESVHVYLISDLGQATLRKITVRNADNINSFLEKYRPMRPEMLEKEVAGLLRR
jgi:hypothetical protein